MGILSATLLSLLQDQYRHETSNSLRYVARSSWARFRGLEATADFFEHEAKDERKHAEIVRKIIEARNAELYPAPYSFDESNDWAAFGDLFTTAQAIERDTTDRLNAIYGQALGESDFMLVIAISELVAIQIEEENAYQTILDRIDARGDDKASTHDIDVWIGETFSAD